MITISPADALALPVDELALIVLSDLAEEDTYNEHNYLNSLRHDFAGLGYRDDPKAVRAIVEALGWLRVHGMTAHDVHAGTQFLTRWGRDALSVTLGEVKAVHRLQGDLHPLIEVKARRQFLLGEYENAIFVSLKAVEIRVRQLAGFGDDAYGVPMMTSAFNPKGPLADPNAPSGEVTGTMMLFAGAYAVLRNPSGHREVSFDDVTEAAEAVQAASLLMRMLDRIEARLAASSTRGSTP